MTINIYSHLGKYLFHECTHPFYYSTMWAITMLVIIIIVFLAKYPKYSSYVINNYQLNECINDHNFLK